MLVVSTGISATTCIEQPVHPLYRFARVLQDDRSDVPYKLECPNGLQVWSKASFVKPAPEGAVFTRIPRPQLGDLVVRAAGSSRDACLATPTTVGKVIVDDRSSMPFKVQCPKAGVSTYWYRAEQVQLAPAGATFEAPSASSVLPENLFAEGPDADAGGMFITTALNVVNQNAVPIVLEEWSLFAPDALQDATGKHFFAPGRLANQDLEGVE